MSDRKQWEHLIRQHNSNRIGRMQKRLFVDLKETKEYLQGLIGVMRDKRVPQHVLTLRAELRRTVLGLTFERTKEVLNSCLGEENFPTLINALFGTGRGDCEEAWTILTRLASVAETQEAVVTNGETSSARWALFMLARGAAVDTTYTWTNGMFELYSRSDILLLRRLFELFSFADMDFAILPYKRWDKTVSVLRKVDGRTRVLFPIPDTLENWVNEQHRLYHDALLQRNLSVIRLGNTLRDSADEVRGAYEHLWLEMMVQPRWALREGGLDVVTIAIPELRQAGFDCVRLTPLSSFPNFRASFHGVHLNGNVQITEMELEPSDLMLVQRGGMENDWIGRVLASVAVHAAWRIVMGREPREKSASGGQRSNGSAIIRARFRRLPEGYHASSEACQRALGTFRQEPLPGFTFVRQYERGDEPQSGEPLFSLSDILP